MATKQKRSTIKKRLWKIISEYIRRKYSDDNGYCKCVTCETVKHYKQMQAGHFVPQAKGDGTRYIEENIHPQCYRCNINLGGFGAQYSQYMRDMYGQEKIDELLALSNLAIKITTPELLDLEQEYKQKLEVLSG